MATKLSRMVEITSEAVEWCGEAPTRFASSNIAERGFCATCGTPLFYRQFDGSTIELMAGTLDAPDAFALNYHYGIEGQRAWLKLNDGLEQRRTAQADLSADARTVISNQRENTI